MGTRLASVVILGMLVVPLAAGLATIPNLGAVYRAAGPAPLAYTALYGMLWGAGTILFGLGITRVGLALGFGIILGISSLAGTIAPLMLLHRDQLFTNAGLFILGGVGITLGGVAACARAGQQREAAEPIDRKSFRTGLGICVLSGLGSASMALAFNESAPISRAAEAFGASPVFLLNAVWPVLLGGGLAMNGGYCAWLLVRRGKLQRFAESAGINIGLTAAMAILWSGSNFFYGAGARKMGELGLVFGWPIFMAAIVLTANVWGFLTGEWRSAGRRAIAWASAGSMLLVAGIWIIAWAGGRQ